LLYTSGSYSVEVSSNKLVYCSDTNAISLLALLYPTTHSVGVLLDLKR